MHRASTVSLCSSMCVCVCVFGVPMAQNNKHTLHWSHPGTHFHNKYTDTRAATHVFVCSIWYALSVHIYNAHNLYIFVTYRMRVIPKRQNNNNNHHSQIRILPSKGNIKYAYGFAFYPRSTYHIGYVRAAQRNRCRWWWRQRLGTDGRRSGLTDKHTKTLCHRQTTNNKNNEIKKITFKRKCMRRIRISYMLCIGYKHRVMDYPRNSIGFL